MSTVTNASTGESLRHRTNRRAYILVALVLGIILVAALLTAGYLFLAGGGAGGGKHSPTTVEVGQAGAGSTVKMYVGDTLQVTLEGNITTGYNWEVASGTGSLLKAAGEPEYRADSAALGSGGKIITRFEAASAGQTALKMIYHRAFEKGVAPLKTFELTVVVEN